MNCRSSGGKLGIGVGVGVYKQKMLLRQLEIIVNLLIRENCKKKNKTKAEMEFM